MRSRIMVEMNDGLCFEISFDETPDISGKEKMVITIRYVKAEGKVIERFMGFYDAFKLLERSVVLRNYALMVKLKQKLSQELFQNSI